MMCRSCTNAADAYEVYERYYGQVFAISKVLELHKSCRYKDCYCQHQPREWKWK